MPFGGVAPSGRLCFRDQGCVHADLVDISDGGACLLVGLPFWADSGQRGVLRFGKPGQASHRQVVEICWQDPWEQGLALGVAFSHCRIQRPSGRQP